MELDPLLLSRIQFAFIVSFHAIFPVFTIGLASYIAVLNGLFYKTKNQSWDQLSLFWTKIFAVVFGMGVVSGIVMSFQFGTNWSNFSYATANFLGPVLSYEVITAFFLEAAFLGVLLFGRNKVPQGVHLFASIMVAVGTFISSFWILSANSWMQTPGGFEMVDGMIHITSWYEAIFNASLPYRFAHMGLASFITGAFVVAGVSAYFILKKSDVVAHKKALSMSLWLLLFLTPMQALVGDFHGLNTLEHQPAKLAAMEGNWETSSNVPLLLFALPDKESQSNLLELGIPNLASVILKHDASGVVPGLQDFDKTEQPSVSIVFWSFRIMVGIGFLMIAVVIVGNAMRRNGRLYQSNLYLKVLVGMIASPFVAVLSGWIVTEAGRSPWLIYGVMTHSQGLTPSLTGPMALFSLIGFILVYSIVFSVGLYYLTKVVKGNLSQTPDKVTSDYPRPARPLSAVNTPFDDLSSNYTS